MEISICIVLIVVSLVMGVTVTYFWLSRKYAQEISDLEVEILEIQRKGTHYKENIEDKLLHAQNAAEDRRRELLSSVQSQKALENKCQQFQTQVKEKSGLLTDANSELKKLKKDVEKNARDKEGWIKEKASLIAERSGLWSEKERLIAENEFWLSEFEAKKHLLMGEEAEKLNNELAFEAENFDELTENAENTDVISEELTEVEKIETALEDKGEAVTQAESPNLLMGQVAEVAETEGLSVNVSEAEEVENVHVNEVEEVTYLPQNEILSNETTNEMTAANTEVVEEVQEMETAEVVASATEPQVENEEETETIIMNIPYLTESVIKTE